jgi:hypothetical protein
MTWCCVQNVLNDLVLRTKSIHFVCGGTAQGGVYGVKLDVLLKAMTWCRIHSQTIMPWSCRQTPYIL